MSRNTALALLILLLATAVRFHALGRQSFWNDEGNTARLSERSVRLILEGTASDIHPPLYYLVLSGWQKLVGTSEFALRSFSAFAGVLTILFTIQLGRWLDGWRVGLVAGLFTAVSPPLIYYSQEARMYSLLGLLAGASTYVFVQGLGTRDKGRGTRDMSPIPRPQSLILYTLLLTAGLYTHYFFPAIIAVHGLVAVSYWLLAISRSARQPVSPQHSALSTSHFLLPTTLALLLYAPWLPIFWRSTGGGGAGWSLTGPFTAEALFWLLVGPIQHIDFIWVVLPLLFTFAVRRMTFIWPPRRGVFYAGVFVPILFMGAAGSVQPQHFKFLTTAVPPFLLIVALRVVGLWELRVTRQRDAYLVWFGRFAATLLAVPMLVGMGLLLRQLYTNPTYFRADYRGMAAEITAEAHPNAAVILNAPNQWEVFTYYYKGTAEVYPFPRFAAPPEQLIPELEQMAAEHGRIYALFWGEAGFDPQRTVESWLDAHAFKAREEWRGDVRFVSYAVPPQTGDEMGTPLGYSVGPAITLAGYTLPQTAARPGDILPLTLFWETAAPISERYKVFVHLVNFEGALVAQRDGEPVGNLRPTSSWVVGEAILDKHGLFLPADLPAGDYALLVGLYDLTDPARRLPITTAAGVVDALQLGIVSVE
ncbi:MAG: glycosyltransferase family 39 protein [Chloroflexi bacterium]|nr:glycosyltransferase family 39 protein [Chloroflexota bacterium]